MFKKKQTFIPFYIFNAVPPPSYDSLFGRVREARKSSSGILGFVMNVAIILLGTSKINKTYPKCGEHKIKHSLYLQLVVQ